MTHFTLGYLAGFASAVLFAMLGARRHRAMSRRHPRHPAFTGLQWVPCDFYPIGYTGGDIIHSLMLDTGQN